MAHKGFKRRVLLDSQDRIVDQAPVAPTDPKDPNREDRTQVPGWITVDWPAGISTQPLGDAEDPRFAYQGGKVVERDGWQDRWKSKLQRLEIAGHELDAARHEGERMTCERLGLEDGASRAAQLRDGSIIQAKALRAKLVALVLFLLMPLAAMAECPVEQVGGTPMPWSVVGQTNVTAGGGVDDPTPAFLTGGIGQLTSLPYTVPTSHDLYIDEFTAEGYDSTGIFVVTGWTGNPPGGATPTWRIEHGLPSAGSKAGTGRAKVGVWLPAGTKFHVRLINGQALTAVYGWGVSGCLAQH